MRPTLRSHLPIGLALLAMGLGYFGIAYRMQPVAQSDPDRYFHLSVARSVAQNGVKIVLPQAEGLSWGEEYPNGYFLFSTLTGGAYRLAGENGALLLAAVLAVVFLVGWFFILRRLAGTEAASLLCLALLLTPDFANRLVTFRPHLAALCALAVLTAGLVFSRRSLIAVGSALFALSYHALYIPLALGACFALAERVESGRIPWRSLAAPLLLGLALGCAVNPYFPSNLEMMTTAFQVAINALKLSAAERPVEVLPLGWSALLTYHLFSLALVGLAGFKLVRAPRGARKTLMACFSAALGFWALALVSRRATEYAIPFSVLAAAAALAQSRLDFSRLRPHLVWGVALLLPGALGGYAKAPIPLIDAALRRQAIDALPKDQPGRVFNCEWASSPFLLYTRPQLSFLDALDPAYLALKAPALHGMRQALLQGQIAYPYGLLRHAFHADFVVCENPYVVGQLERDPGFQRLYPTDFRGGEYRRAGTLFVYRVAPEPPPSQVFAFDAAEGTQWKALAGSHLEPAQRSAYLNLDRLLAPTRTGNQRCATLRPSLSELAQHRGARWAGVGGGVQVQLRWNGKVIFDRPLASPTPRLLTDWVALPSSLSESDRLEALVCSPNEASYLGFALSLWTQEQWKRACPTEPLRQAASNPSPGALAVFYREGSWCQLAGSEVKRF